MAQDGSNTSVSRRTLLGAGLAAIAAGGLPRAAHAAAPSPSGAARRVLRFAHPTDIHVQPELRGGEGMAAAFRHMMALDEPPELIITGGDLPMDTASTPEETSRVQWDLFQRVLRETVPASVPIYHTLGNHDIFGRDKKACRATGEEAVYGRKWFLQNFGYEKTWQSFDRAGWHFVILDSIDLLPDGDEYVCRIRGEQLDWLRRDLASTALPTVVVSHVPIISAASFFDSDDDEWVSDAPDLKVSTKRTHADCRELEELFFRHPHVRLCLSGHLHQLARSEYNGVTYISEGAVCGAKWKGPKRRTPEGYGIIDLYDDGTFRHQYMTFGWKAETRKKKG